MWRTFASTLVLIAGLLAFVSPVATTVAVNFDAAHRIQNRLTPEHEGGRIYAGGVPLQHPGAVTLYYERRGYRPAWSDATGPNDRPDRLLHAVRSVIDDGFTSEHYPLDRLERTLRYAWYDPEDTAVLVELDIIFTDAMFTIAHDLSSGLVDPKTLGVGRKSFAWDELAMNRIEWGLRNGNLIETLEGFRPRQPEYEKLRKALKYYAELAQREEWPKVEVGKTLRKGDRDERVAQIRRRLAATGELPSGASRNSTLFDDQLRDAVREFQDNNGLSSDGVAGEMTITMLNIGPSDIARKIELNLERWRWLPEDLGRRYLWVDIPGGQLEMVDDNNSELKMRIMIGRIDDPTPTFSDTMTYIVMNPSWEVPASIVMKKLYPYFSEDKTFFERHGIEVYSGWRSGARRIDPTLVDWKKYDPGYLPFRFRQKPGPLNAMGRIKFMFPNKYSIYLHDTPSRYLFARERYAYTSGCVRVRRPVDLAAKLLEDSSWWNEKKIDRELRKGSERVVHLKRPIPVHLAYFTVIANDDGTVRLQPDIYGWDDLLDSVLDSGLRPVLAAQPASGSPVTARG